MVDRISQRLVAQKTVHQKNAPVLVERTGDPDGQRNADEQVGYIGPNGRRRALLPCDGGDHYRFHSRVSFLVWLYVSVISVNSEITVS